MQELIQLKNENEVLMNVINQLKQENLSLKKQIKSVGYHQHLPVIPNQTINKRPSFVLC